MWKSAAIASIVCLVAATGAVLAQAPSGSDPIPELLKEVRALRLALENAALIDARSQLLVARVQLQEQRILEVTRRITDVRATIGSLDAELSSMRSQAREFERQAAATSELREREAMEQMTENFTSRIELASGRRGELGTELAQLEARLAEEEARWMQFNDRLEQLERALAPR